MSETYEVLSQLPEGTTDFEIVTTFKGFPKSNRRSGHTTPGDKELEILNLYLEPKANNKPGRNIHLETKVVEDGVIIHKYMPVPQDEVDTDAGYRMWRQLTESVLSFSGLLDSNVGRTASVKAQDLVGKRLAARVVDGEGDYRDTSGIERFLSKEEWELSLKRKPVDTRTDLGGNGSAKEAVGRALFQ